MTGPTRAQRRYEVPLKGGGWSPWLRWPLLRRRDRRCAKQPLHFETLEGRILLDTGLGPPPAAGATDAERFVANLYADFLHRPAQANEEVGWVRALQAGLSREQILSQFTSSEESLTNLVADTYWSLLGRAPEPAATAEWWVRLRAGESGAELTAMVLASVEYSQQQPGGDAGWLAAVYRDVLGRAADAEGQAYWLADLARGVPRWTVALGIVTSPEGRDRAVDAAYRGLLGRAPDAAGAAAWVAALGQGLTPVQVAAGIAASPEYAALPAVDPAGAFGTGSLLVQLKPGMEAAVARLRPWAQARGATVEATAVPGLFEVRGGPAELARLADAFAARPFVSYAEPNQTVQAALTPNDPRFTDGTLYGLNGTNGIQASAAWDTTTGSTSITVAVIDSGIDYRHPDLYLNVWVNQGEIPAARRANLSDTDGDGLITFWDLNEAVNQGPGKITDVNGNGRIDAGDLLAPYNPDGSGGWANGTSDDGDSYVDDLVGWNFVSNTNNPFDDLNHGTHVAGTIGAVGNNGLGSVGVAWKTQLMPLKFLNASGNGSNLAAANAIRYAADHGARVSNNSWGGGGQSNTIFNALDYARTRGHLVVAAVGNNGRNTDTTPFYPASYNLPNILSVAATNSNGTRAGFSNYGPTSVDLAAPGSGIYSTLPGGGYGFLSGTSMAAPHVTGAVALLLAQNPTATVAQVVDRLLTTASQVPGLAGMVASGGIVNAAEAVRPTTDLHWADGGLTVPADASTQASFTVPRTYTIGVGAVANDFTIAYYASTDTTFGNGDDLFLGSETVRASDDKTLGAHSGTSPALRIGRPGPHYLIAVLDAGKVIGETSETNNVLVATEVIRVTGLADLIVDNGHPGYAETGPGWYGRAAGSGGSHRAHAAGTGSDTATWQVTGLPAGTYQVHATWVAAAAHATDAPYQVYDGSVLRWTGQVNQRQAPSGTTINGVVFQPLGTVTVTGGTLRVVLTNAAGGVVSADAIRVLGLPSTPVDLSWSGEGITGPATANAQTPFTLNRTYSISGAPAPGSFTIAYYASTDPVFGNADDVLLASETITAAADRTVGSHGGPSPALQLASPGTYYLFARVDDGNAIVESDESNNVALAPQAVVVVGPVIVDNEDAGYSEEGAGWASWPGGYGGSFRYASEGTGFHTAAWQLNGLPAGTYEVQITWVLDPAAAMSAPYQVYDGPTLIHVEHLDQRQAPSGVMVGGVAFQAIATVNLTSGTLRVVLAYEADGYVTADAVRVVPV